MAVASNHLGNVEHADDVKEKEEEELGRERFCCDLPGLEENNLCAQILFLELSRT
jgi:hypothetical protein